MTLKELREKRGDCESRYNGIVRKAESQNRDLTDSEVSELSDIVKEDQALKNRIERQEYGEQWGRELDQPTDRRISGRGSAAGDDLRWGEPGNVQASDIDMTVSAFARNAHGRPVPMDEVEACERSGHHIGASALDINLNAIRPTLGRDACLFGPSNRMTNGLGTVDPAKGGALVPGGFYANLEVAMRQFGPMLETSEVMTTEDGREMPWPTLDDTGESGELIAEGEEASEGEMNVGALILRAHKQSSKVIRANQNLIDDSALDIAGEVGRALGTRLGRGANSYFTNGVGANQPRGIVPRATVGKTTASATAITADEVLDLIASVDPAYQSGLGVGLMMNSTIFSYLLKLKDSQGRYLIGDMKNASTPMLRGWPVYLNQAMTDTIASGNRTIIFGKLNAYKVRLVRNIRLRTLTELYAKADEVGFLAFQRFDGDLLDAGTHPVKCLEQHS